MSFAYTPNYTFDGSSTDSSYENYSSGDDVYDEFGIDKIEITGSFITIHFTDSTSMSDWRGEDRGITLEYTGSGSSSAWEGSYDLTTSEEYSVNTTYNYIHYSWTDMGLSSGQKDDLADDVASAGAGNSVLNINNLG